MRILLILGMLAAMCGTVSADVGVIAETQTIEVGAAPACTAPCECLSENDAAQRWGAQGYEQCSKTICGQSSDAMIQYYCFHQVGGLTSQSLVVSGTATTVPAATPSAVSQTTAQATVQAPAQTTAQPPVEVTTGAAAPVNPSPSYTWPAASATPQRTPVGTATVLAAIGAALLAAAGTRRK